MLSLNKAKSFGQRLGLVGKFISSNPLMPELPAVEVAPPLPEPEPIPVIEAEPVYDQDDLDTPAYLRQGRLIN